MREVHAGEADDASGAARPCGGGRLALKSGAPKRAAGGRRTMRVRIAELVAAGALASTPLALHAAPAASPAPAAAQPDPVLAFYPAAARAAGVEGQATIRCSRNEHLKLVRCSIVSESPSGQGFGDAALAMAAQSKDNPKVTMPDVATAASADQIVKFTLHPPNISPDITRMAHVVSNPTMVTQPTRAQIEAAYPVRALADSVRGGAEMVCIVDATGHLESCRVSAEDPSGYGFGQAAVDLASDFLLKPGKLDGEPVSGRQVRVTVAFATGDPDAPLSLQTRPADAKPGDPNSPDPGGMDAGPAQPPPPR
jgi:hypothetical protein